ncbi:hypothetical protein SB778_12455 [Paraburkholderia sp. SIMBA_050]
MSTQEKSLNKLRNIINENLRTQIGNDKVNYISTGHTLSDVTAKQSHCIFARRGCGKTLLLHHSRRQLDDETRAIYINCEDFKHHSFPNVLIELIDATFRELDRNLLGWFGKSKKLKAILTEVRTSLATLRQAPDQQSIEVKAARSEHAERKNAASMKLATKVHSTEASASAGADRLFRSSSDIERKYVQNENKLQQLNHNLPGYKNSIRDFFQISAKLRSVFIQIDDFYHLSRADQPFVADYIHRLCKDTPLSLR